MNDVKALPCHRAIDAECFGAHPAWARQALAYKLLHVFCPPWLTRRLPKFLRLPLIAPGVDVPAGAYLPPGTVIGPDTVFPPGWVSPDPPPDGVYIPPGTEFPPGWTPGDPLPDGVTVDPGAVFPPGWTPGDPLPDGVTIDPGAAFPAGWQPGDPLPDGVTLDPAAAFPPGWTPGDSYPEGVGLPAPLSSLQQETGVTTPLHLQQWGPLSNIPHPFAAAEDTVVSLFGSTSDGNVECGWDPSWSLVWTGNATIVVNRDQDSFMQATRVYAGPGFNYLARTFLFFNLAGLPVGKTVKAVSLHVHAGVKNPTAVCIQEGTQHDPLVDADFTAYTGPVLALHAWGTGWIEVAFNQDGLDFFTSRMGYVAKLCLREYTQDYPNQPPVGIVDIAMGLSYQEQIEGYRPYLVITY